MKNPFSSLNNSSPFLNTYCIIARDKQTGEIGVAAQSHWFAVGSVLPWVQAGTGIVTTQSFASPHYGIEGLKLLKRGLEPDNAIRQLLKDDEGYAYRQLAIMDVEGRTYAYTGSNCIAYAGHILGDEFIVQGNLLESEEVLEEMSEAFMASRGAPLAERMLTALAAAQDLGGDIRGVQSAVLQVVSSVSTGNPWIDRKVDLHIPDHSDPVNELVRLLRIHRAYENMNRGDEAVSEGNMEEAARAYSEAQMMMPQNEEMKFWQAVTLVNVGRYEEAKALFEQVFQRKNRFKKLLPRLMPTGLLQINEQQLEELLNLA